MKRGGVLKEFMVLPLVDFKKSKCTMYVELFNSNEILYFEEYGSLEELSEKYGIRINGDEYDISGINGRNCVIDNGSNTSLGFN